MHDGQIALISSFGPDHLHLVSPFIEHYRLFGVNAFFLNVHFDSRFPQESHAGFIEKAAAILARHGVSVHSSYAVPFDAMAIRRHHEAIQCEIASQFRWIVWADIDEFHEFPCLLPDLVERLETNECSYVKGRFIDRMARRGLPDFSLDQSPWQQFPIGTNITRAVLGGVCDKVMLGRSDISVIPGHHDISPDVVAKAYPGVYAVHHFKWDQSVVARLKLRLEKDWRDRCTWWVQSARALEWLSRGCAADLEGIQRYDFQDDHFENGGGPFSGNVRYRSSVVVASCVPEDSAGQVV